ncbi:hypothetical protein Tco_1019791 [Tanacetum coccineum]|uniref:Uncharacterized protein n=1 Tax=Tanacetum coccineum TaxID=301880 RepID=A0ABQ5FY49_9ASTR
MASDDGDQDARYALSKLLQRGTVVEYESEFLMLIKRVTGISESLLKSFYISGFKLALQCALLRSYPTTLGEAFSLARATEARFAEDALSKLLQMELLRARPTSLEEAFSLARITEARFEDERSTTSIAKTNDLNTELPVQDIEETIRHKPNKVEAVKTSMVSISEELEQHEYQDDLNEISEEKDDAKPTIFADTFSSNGGKFQEGDMVDALSRVELKSLGNWKELDNESEDRIKSAFQDDTLRARWF